MPGLSNAFDEFLTKITVTHGQNQQISQRRERLLGELQSIWRPDQIIPIGSFARGTVVGPVSDVDLMLVLNEGTVDRKSVSAVLNDIHGELARRRPGASIRVQKRSVGLRFEDFDFDIVPAELRARGGFRIPDVEANKWIYTNPRKHASFADERDKLCGGKAKPIVRMLKVWNKNKQIGLKSFHLEVMTFNSLGKEPTSYAQGMRDALLGIAGAVKSSCGDPAGSGKTLDEYLDLRKRDEIAQRCKQAADELGTAIQEDERRQSQEAIERVRRLIGDRF